LIHSLQVKPPSSFTPEETEYLTKRIQDGGTEVVQVIFFFFLLFSWSTWDCNTGCYQTTLPSVLLKSSAWTKKENQPMFKRKIVTTFLVTFQ
jgi:hypothetical protein